MKHTVLVVSDLHCGHHEALWHPSVRLPWGQNVEPTVGQKYLYDCWKDLLATARRRKVSIVVVNGDLIDGEQRKSAGTEAATTILAAQQKSSIKLLEPLRDIKTVKDMRIIRGTPYHDGRLGMDVEQIATSLDCIGPNPDWHSWSFLDLDIEGTVLNFSHGISVAGGLYRATPHDREGVWSALASKEGRIPKASCVIRSHCHYFTHVEHSTTHIVTSPAWQLQTEYMRKNSVYRMMPDIGALFIEVDPDAKKNGDDPIIVRKHLYRLPEVRVSKARA